MRCKDRLGQNLKHGDKVVFAPRANIDMPHVLVGTVTYIEDDSDDPLVTIYYVRNRGKSQSYSGHSERFASAIVKVAA